MVEVKVIRSGPFRLCGRARRRKQAGGIGHHRETGIELRIQHVYSAVLKDWRDAQVAQHAHGWSDAPPFLPPRLQQLLLRGLVFSFGIRGLRERSQRLWPIVLLPEKVSLGQQELVIGSSI